MPIPVVKQINSLLWYFHRRHERRWLQHNVQCWERTRLGGRARFVCRCAFRWGISMDLFTAAWRYFTEGHFSYTYLFLSLPLWLLGGWLVGAGAWSQNEILYERAQRGEGAEIRSGGG